jgi:mono/diheme cytochrome c family protein
MIRPRMARPVKLVLVSIAMVAAAGVLSACAVSFGAQTIKVAKSQGPLYQGAVLFNQRCAGCHTLSYAATHGSASNVRTAQYNNGPNFDQRCERPAVRVLYAIENGGFSGAIMPQNIVVGNQAREVAMFVATYSGRKAPRVPGVPDCPAKPVGTLPSPAAAGATGATGVTAATAQAKKATKVNAKASGKTKPSKAQGKGKGKRSSTGKGQGLGPG